MCRLRVTSPQSFALSFLAPCSCPQARRQNLTGVVDGGRGASATSSNLPDEALLMKVLCHRADKISSKYLKENFQVGQ